MVSPGLRNLLASTGLAPRSLPKHGSWCPATIYLKLHCVLSCLLVRLLTIPSTVNAKVGDIMRLWNDTCQVRCSIQTTETLDNLANLAFDLLLTPHISLSQVQGGFSSFS